MLQVALVISVVSTVALLLGFSDIAVAAATGSVVLLCLASVAFVATTLVAVGCTLAGRAHYWFPPPG